ncbi:MAG: DEAD/DEAH box helicase family protein [Planctomycetota bacterium]
MELKRFQREVLGKVGQFLDCLDAERQKGNLQHATLDAWKLATGLAFPGRERRTGAGRDLPTFCIKIPTGGGKTLLAAHILGRIQAGLLKSRNGSGLALWVVPSDQIYKDTLRALRDRRHPYREALEFANGRPVEVWEKHEVFRLTPGQLADRLNVLVIKLASANRETRDQLKLFQDSGGNIIQHFPPEDDAAAHGKLRERVPNLDTLDGEIALTSLANLIRLCEPAVILDEGHKAYSELAQKTIEGFNASIVVELSATPPREANVLVKVTGQDLLKEEMIKLPINIAVSGVTDWKICLAQAKDRRDALAKQALEIAGPLPLIRPIVLVQAERTGKDQREADLVHAEDVKAHLIERLGVSEHEIAIKSSDKDDIEGIDLLDEGCRIQWIITRSALQEGWDCPFAYILVSLMNTKSEQAMTQLVGRVLRQPFAQRSTAPELNESYVYCLQRSAADITREVKKALEREGYDGDAASIVDRSAETGPQKRPVARMRPAFRRHYREFKGRVYLPRFCVKSGKDYESLDYFRHLVATVDVGRFDYAAIDWNLASDLEQAKDLRYRLTLGQRDAEHVGSLEVTHVEPDEKVKAWLVANLAIDHFNYSDLRLVASKAIDRLLKGYPDLTGKLALVKFALRERLAGFIQSQTDAQTEAAFRELMRKGRLCFYLECRECRFELPPEVQLRSTRQLVHPDNSPVERSLFDVVPEESLNEYETTIALFLDKHPEVLWWYRNEVGAEHFSIQGYRRHRVYPDFVVQQGSGKKPAPSVLVVESKGEHLEGNLDTLYKRSLAEVFTSLGKSIAWQDLGAGFENSKFRFQVIQGEKHGAWKDELQRLLSA